MSDKFRRKKEPKHIRLYYSMVTSEAWKHTSGAAVKVLIALVLRDNGSRNGEISFSVREAAEAANISTRTAKRCLDELEAKGWIECTERGAFSRKVSHASLWRYTWAASPACKKGPTRDFEKWSADGNTRGQVLQPSVSLSASAMETPALAEADIATGGMETPLVSVNPQSAKSTTHTSYQGEGSADRETEARKQANPVSGAFLDDLRANVADRLDRSPPGEQSRLAEVIGIPGGTLSKFLNGRSLPEQYRAPLAAALAA